MKTSNLLILGGAALLVAYLYTRNASAASDNVQSSGLTFDPTDDFNKRAAAQGITPADAIAVINENPSSIRRNSATLARDVTYTTPDGVVRTGNIAQLGTGAKVAVSVTPAVRDSRGMSALDRMIAKNQASKTPAQLARKKAV